MASLFCMGKDINGGFNFQLLRVDVLLKFEYVNYSFCIANNQDVKINRISAGVANVVVFR